MVPVGEPARIEAVWFQAIVSTATVGLEGFVLQFALSDGTVVFTQPTPVFNSEFSTSLFCSWARGNNDTYQLPGVAIMPVEAALPEYANPPLPEMVLPALSTISIALYEASDDNSGTFTVVDPAVTYTPGVGPTSATAGAVGLPLLVDTSTG